MRTLIALAIAALPFRAQAQAPAAVTYALSSGTALHVRVYKDPSTVAAGLSHDHAIASTQHSGTVTYDPANPAACAINLTVPVAGLDPDPDALRQKVGLPGVLDAGARSEIKEHMLDEGQLHAKAFPTISFVSTGCAPAGDKIKVSGTLTIRGKSQPVSLNMTVKADATAFSASGSLPIRATQFGFQPYSAMLGALKNKDEMTLVVTLAGKPR